MITIQDLYNIVGKVTGGQVPRHGGYKYPRYAESDRGLNQSVAEAA